VTEEAYRIYDPFMDAVWEFHNYVGRLRHENRVGPEDAAAIDQSMIDIYSILSPEGVSVGDVLDSLPQYLDALSRLRRGFEDAFLSRARSQYARQHGANALREIDLKLSAIYGYLDRITVVHVELQRHFILYLRLFFNEDAHRPFTAAAELYELRDEYFETASPKALEDYLAFARRFLAEHQELVRNTAEVVATVSLIEDELEVMLLLQHDAGGRNQ
jgi:hypothetical protein